jgi:hypothetical protein
VPTLTVGRVNSLTLIARFDKGTLQYLQWHDMGCGSCADGDACMAVGDGYSACAGTEAACTVGLYKSNPVYPRSNKAPGFNPSSLK